MKNVVQDAFYSFVITTCIFLFTLALIIAQSLGLPSNTFYSDFKQDIVRIFKSIRRGY